MASVNGHLRKLNWRGLVLLGLVTVGLVIGLQLVARQAADEAVDTVEARLRAEGRERAAAELADLRAGCQRTDDFKVQVIAFLRAARAARMADKDYEVATTYSEIIGRIEATRPFGGCKAAFPMAAS